MRRHPQVNGDLPILHPPRNLHTTAPNCSGHRSRVSQLKKPHQELAKTLLTISPRITTSRSHESCRNKRIPVSCTIKTALSFKAHSQPVAGRNPLDLSILCTESQSSRERSLMVCLWDKTMVAKISLPTRTIVLGKSHREKMRHLDSPYPWPPDL